MSSEGNLPGDVYCTQPTIEANLGPQHMLVDPADCSLGTASMLSVGAVS